MKRHEAYFILIATFIVVLVWIVFSIVDSAVSSTVPKKLHAQLLPIQPSFNTKVIDGLKKRNKITPQDPQATIATTSASPVSFEIQGPTPTISLATNSGAIQGVTP